MKEALRQICKIWHYEGGLYRSGPHDRLRGDMSRLYGDVSGIEGDATGVFGTCTGIGGNLDQCELTDEDRKKGVFIGDLVVIEDVFY